MSPGALLRRKKNGQQPSSHAARSGLGEINYTKETYRGAVAQAIEHKVSQAFTVDSGSGTLQGGAGKSAEELWLS